MVHIENLTVEYPARTVCHGQIMTARQIFKVLMRSLPLRKTQIYIKGDRLPDGRNGLRTHVNTGRQSRQSVIYCDFYTKKEEVEDAIKTVISDRFHVRFEEIGLIWERGGELFK